MAVANWSRQRDALRRFTPLCDALGRLRVKDAILDGEVICIDGEGVSQFNELLFVRRSDLYAFELVWLNGHDLRDMRLVDRKERPKRLVMRADNPSLLFADHVDGYGLDFFRIICEKDLKGIVAKHRASPYAATAKWIKIKNPTYTQSQRPHELFEQSQRRRRMKREADEVEHVHRRKEENGELVAVASAETDQWPRSSRRRFASTGQPSTTFGSRPVM